MKRLDVSVRRLEVLLSEDERQRAAHYRLSRDRRRFIAARALLRQLLAERLARPPQAVEFRYGKNGKPALARGDWRFNLSHCNDVAVYVFARGREIGVDIEAIRPLPEADDIAARFFSAAENAVFRSLELRARTEAFFNCWTRKEAFVKAVGDGLSMPLDGFEVTLAPGEPAKLIRVGDLAGEDAGWHLDSFSPWPGFVAAVASQDRSFQ